MAIIIGFVIYALLVVVVYVGAVDDLTARHGTATALFIVLGGPFVALAGLLAPRLVSNMHKAVPLVLYVLGGVLAMAAPGRHAV